MHAIFDLKLVKTLWDRFFDSGKTFYCFEKQYFTHFNLNFSKFSKFPYINDTFEEQIEPISSM